MFRKLFYGVGGSCCVKNEDSKTLERNEINHRKRRKMVFGRMPSGAKTYKTVRMFHALAGKNNRQLKGKSRRSPNPKCTVHKGH